MPISKSAIQNLLQVRPDTILRWHAVRLVKEVDQHVAEPILPPGEARAATGMLRAE
jgi:hypothetical protein